MEGIASRETTASRGISSGGAIAGAVRGRRPWTRQDGAGNQLWEVLRTDDPLARPDGRGGQHLLQLADIETPLVKQERLGAPG